MSYKQQRPKFLNLFKIHLPVTGVTSIVHRISGAVLFLAIPGLIYLFNLSLSDEESFIAIAAFFDQLWFKVLVTILGWALVHHVLAGIRFLLTDVAIGIRLPVARATAWLVNIVSVLALLMMIVLVWR